MKKMTMKSGGKITKAKSGSSFAKLAPPYNKATFADKIAGAKKNAGKAMYGKTMKAKSGTKMPMKKMMGGGKCRSGC
jgi:hypothetical protein